jgi:hypothetical protein
LSLSLFVCGGNGTDSPTFVGTEAANDFRTDERNGVENTRDDTNKAANRT